MSHKISRTIHGIKFTFHTHNWESKKPTKLFCYSLFRMKGPYNDITNYVYPLRESIKKLPKSFPGYKIRIYYDNSLLNTDMGNHKINTQNKELLIPFFEELKNNTFVELFKYDFPQFKTENKKYHRGTFGTFVRFFPMFDTSIDANISVSTSFDADDDMKLRYNKTMLNKIVRSKSNFHAYAVLCPEMGEKLFRCDIVYKCWGGTLVNKAKFPMRLLTNFLHKILGTIKDERLHKAIQSIRKTNKYKTQHTISNVVYGIDQFFLQMDITEYLVDHKIPFSVSLVPVLYVLFSKIANHTKGFTYFKRNKRIIKTFFIRFIRTLSSNPILHIEQEDNILTLYRQCQAIIRTDTISKNKRQMIHTVQQASRLILTVFKQKHEKYFGWNTKEAKLCVQRHNNAAILDRLYDITLIDYKTSFPNTF